MRTRLLWAALSLFCGCRRDPCRAAPDVLACVDGAALTLAEVQEFVRPLEWMAGIAARPDPRIQALDRAIRAHLFAAEARRRALPIAAGLPAGSLAVLAQALIADELLRHGIDRERVPEAEARRYYDEHPESFGQIDEFRAQAIVVADPALAERVYREALGADEAAFGALARRYSTDEPSRAKNGDYGVIHAIRESDPELLALGLGLRRAGAIGGPVRGRDGRYYLLRVTEAPVHAVPPWGALTLAKARNLIVRQRRNAALDALATRLRAHARVRIFEPVLSQLEPARPDPRW
jgi:hypothetical protein